MHIPTKVVFNFIVLTLISLHYARILFVCSFYSDHRAYDNRHIGINPTAKELPCRYYIDTYIFPGLCFCLWFLWAMGTGRLQYLYTGFSFSRDKGENFNRCHTSWISLYYPGLVYAYQGKQGDYFQKIRISF